MLSTVAAPPAAPRRLRPLAMQATPPIGYSALGADSDNTMVLLRLSSIGRCGKIRGVVLAPRQEVNLR